MYSMNRPENPKDLQNRCLAFSVLEVVHAVEEKEMVSLGAVVGRGCSLHCSCSLKFE